MRIGMFSWETLHSIAVGGIAAHVSELAEALACRGHDVHIFTRKAAGQDRHSSVRGVQYHRCEFDLHQDFLTEINNMCNSFAWHMGEAAAQAGPFDVVHGHDWLVTKALVQARNQHNSACVFTIHSTEYGRCGNHNYDGRSRMIRDLEWEGAYCSDRVIAVSGVLGMEFVQHYALGEDKVSAIYNGVQAERFAAPIDVGLAKTRLGLGPTDPTVLFCGRLAWQKAPDLFVESVPAVLNVHPAAKFLIVGDGEMHGGLERRVHELGVAHAVRFLGCRRGQELADLFKTPDVVCVPSRNEPFGIVILEAWSAGKPVVVTRNGGPAEFVRHRVDGFMINDQVDSIVWGLLEAFRDFDRLRQMGRAGRQRVTAEFSWDHIAEKTERIYHQAVHDNRQRLGHLDCSGRHLKDARSVASSRVNAFVGGERAAEELHKAA
jgi:glycosyltransferase involved in cell wall biosynthesis